LVGYSAGSEIAITAKLQATANSAAMAELARLKNGFGTSSENFTSRTSDG
jgi:hypothetical protein